MTKSTLFLIPTCIFFLACISKKKNINRTESNNSCEFCKNIQAFDYPYRARNFSINNPEIVDTIQILTTLEIKKIEESIFCFLGKSKTEVDHYFDPSSHSYIYQNGNIKQAHYLFTKGSFFNGGNAIYEHEIEQYESVTLLYTGEYQLMMNFTEKNGELIYTGTKKDSMQLANCIRDKR